jgi:hypothetical protein
MLLASVHTSSSLSGKLVSGRSRLPKALKGSDETGEGFGTILYKQMGEGWVDYGMVDAPWYGDEEELSDSKPWDRYKKVMRLRSLLFHTLDCYA